MAVELETWIRITAFLPVGKQGEKAAAEAVVEWLQGHCDGVTVSDTQDALFAGYFRDDEKHWVFDPVSVLLLDLKRAREDVALLVRLIHAQIHARYNERGCHQQVVLATTHDLSSSTYDFYATDGSWQ